MAAVVTDIIEQFKAEASRAGAVVYEAASAEEARNYFLKLARGHGVKHAVKSKSKTADEIKLSKHLEKAGIEVTEADIGDWMAQQAVVKSATRKIAGQAVELISRAKDRKPKPDHRILLNAANRAIRQSCIDADMGISEADAAIAETGTLVIAGNEGVTRLVAVLPRIHVTLVNCQNVVSFMEDVFSKLKSIAGGMVGQEVPSYVTYITGRNTTADIPGAVLARAQGPAEEHIVLVNKAGKRNTT